VKRQQPGFTLPWAKQATDTVPHFPGRFVGECNGTDFGRVNVPFRDEPGNAVG
jgi:hypothetical protein